MKDEELDWIDPTKEKRSLSPTNWMNTSFNKSNPNNTNNFSKGEDYYKSSPRPNKLNSNSRIVGDERVEEEVYAINSRPKTKLIEEPENKKAGGPLSVVSGMEYNEDMDYYNVQDIQDSIDLVTDLGAVDLAKDNTIATALKFSHFYVAREVDAWKWNVFRFKIVKSKTLAIFLGI